jgi:glycosyltransferase involved in cell wall biosynthesis
MIPNTTKTLMTVTEGLLRHSREEMDRLEASNEFPRMTLFENVLNTDILTPESLTSAPVMFRALYHLLPVANAQALEAYRVRKQYDAIISWSERRALSYALVTKLFRSTTPHVALMYWMSKPKQAFFLRRLHSQINYIITWTSVQRDYAISNLGIPAEKILFVRHPVDQKFFRPVQRATNMICAVGSEMRDYHTLIKAMKNIDIRCHIAAAVIRVIHGNKAQTISADTFGVLPSNVTVGFKPYGELRELYAQSRFAVVPLLPSDTDNGVNAILEAMAMGKAVICSRTRGQVDVIEEGKTGLFVEQGNPRALREAIEYLWNNPDVAERMGRSGRAYIEQHHSLDNFVETVRHIVQCVIEGKRPLINTQSQEAR